MFQVQLSLVVNLRGFFGWGGGGYSWRNWSLGELTKLRNASTSFVMCVRPSVRSHGITRLLLNGFSLNLTFEDLSKICEENTSFINV
jgi:hypothetical protein